MFRSIVVGYEGPDRGDEAIALAEVLRDPLKGTLRLISAYPPAPLPIDGFVAPEDLRDEAENALATLATGSRGGSRRTSSRWRSDRAACRARRWR